MDDLEIVAGSAGPNLNHSCTCVTLDHAKLCHAVELATGDPEFCRQFMGTRPNLFSSVPVFLRNDTITQIASIISTIENVAANKFFADAVTQVYGEVAGRDFGTRGVFMGYDFHLSENGPKLIEINTNAGGAFLNALLSSAQIECCEDVKTAIRSPHPNDFLLAAKNMFLEEWKLQRGDHQLKRVAIVDDNPNEQYLYPEFVLARQMFLRANIDAIIVDARSLTIEADKLCSNGKPIDLVYNRLTDFDFSFPEHAILRRAYIENLAVFTPGPRHYALFANKRNLAVLSDKDALRGCGVSEDEIAILARHIPRTILVTPENAPSLWKDRKNLFFKPHEGYGSKAVYRGDRLTTAVWSEISKGGYVAQEYAAPSERTVVVDGVSTKRKMDVRIYTYSGKSLLTAARLYQGQATNFRTPGGGFAPVLVV